jgi:hypothetical protein
MSYLTLMLLRDFEVPGAKVKKLLLQEELWDLIE